MAFKMKAGPEGPMKKNFPSAFKAPHEFLVEGAGDATKKDHTKGIIEATMRTDTAKNVVDNYKKGQQKILDTIMSVVG
tara:strand:- start:1690 stop:1923 length:234 start_codon:yes stop_codon:yes gene_type:complete